MPDAWLTTAWMHWAGTPGGRAMQEQLPRVPRCWSMMSCPMSRCPRRFAGQALRQWVLSFPFLLRFLPASCPEFMGKVLGIVQRVLSTHLIRQAGFTRATAQTGAVTLIQRFGWCATPVALNLNPIAARCPITCSFSTACMSRTGMENYAFTG